MFVFIDASNLWAAQKAKARMFDYQKLIEYIRMRFNAKSMSTFYYTAYPAAGTRSYDLTPRHNFFTYLKKGLGVTVRKKELKRINETNGESQSVIEKGNMDVEITIDAIHFSNEYEAAILFTGDSDFLALVSYLRRKGKRVFIFSSKNNISHELKTGGDGYSDVLTISEDIWGKPLLHRKQIP